MKAGVIKIIILLLGILCVNKNFSQEMYQEYLNYYHQEIPCHDLKVDLEKNIVFAAGKNGIYVIENGNVKKQIFNDNSRTIFYDKENQFLYSSKRMMVGKDVPISESIVKIDLKTDSVSIRDFPIQLIGFHVKNNIVLNLGRKPNSYDIVSLNDTVLKPKTFYTYLDDNDVLKVSEKRHLNREVDIKFRDINEAIYIYEGMYVNSQKNKLKGIYSITDNFQKVEPKFNFLKNKIVRSLNHSDGRLIASTLDSIFVFNDRKIINRWALPKFFNTENEIPHEVFELSENNFLIQTHKKNQYAYSLYKYNALNSKVVVPFVTDFNLNDSNFKVLIDANKNIWIGRFEKGLRLFFNEKDNYIISHTHKKKPIKQILRYFGELILVSEEIPNYDSKKIKFPDTKMPISFDVSKNKRRYFVYSEPPEDVLELRNIFTEKGYLLEDANHLIEGNYVQSVSDSLTYIENTDAISIVDENTGKFTSHTKSKKFKTFKINKIAENLYISSNIGIVIFNLKTQQFELNKFKNQNEIIFIKQKNNNQLLLVRKQKLELINKSTNKVIYESSHNFKINDAFIYNDNVWLATTNNGVVICNNQLEQIRKIDNSKYLKTAYDIRENFSLNKSAIYIATDNGLLLIDVDKIIFRELKSADYTYKIENNNLSLVKNNITSPNIYFFRYQIDDKGWGNLTNNTLNLNNLSHGAHSIEYQYFTNNKWVTFNSHNFKITEEWYKRPSYIVILALFFITLITIALLFIARNQRKRRKETEAILSEKIILESKLNNIQTEIAMDLHDNFGNRVAGISSITGILQDLHKTDTFDKTQIDKFLTHLEISVKQLDLDIFDLIWSNNPNNNQLIQIANRIEAFGLKMSKQLAGLTIEVQLETDKNYELPRYWNRQIILIAKEIVNNAIKYSKSKSILIKIKGAKNRLYIYFIDQGIGFDITKIKRLSGLSNIKKRAASLECEIVIDSKINIGTTVIFQGEIPN